MRSVDIKTIKGKIQEWIKNYISSAKADGVVIGLSGGIDSSVTAALCAEALGKESVISLSLPCESNPQDIEDAELIAKQLGIYFLKIPLTPLLNKLKASINIDTIINQSELNSLILKDENKQRKKLALANVKPRLRMTILYYIGQSLGVYLVAGTGNRTEIAIGYFTKYGDGGVDFEPLGDLYKCEVRRLARYLKIPNKIIEKPPSAGLWKGQTDEDEIGIPYDEIDEIIYRIDNNLDLSNLNQKNVLKVKRMMKTSSHKKSMPPIYMVDEDS
jgi:NAD+ synthase